MGKQDIFISYRRQDADAHAYVLYRDLTTAGYSVFYDRKSLGAGNFMCAIEKSIDQCQDFILLLSRSALDSRIHNDSDAMRMEITYALKKRKNIIGIMLSGFDGFPSDLPRDIEELSMINCLYGKMEYYDAMMAKLLSGRFLNSLPIYAANHSTPIDKSNKEQTLAWIKTLSIEQRQQYIKLLLDLMHEFNSSPECMRLYQYLDKYDRNRGIQVIEDYKGNIPTDYATYLSYFETMYLILATETLDISLIDALYRFRFFAICNNPKIQASELLPLGYQYPNILKLYDLWFDYIIHKHLVEKETSTITEEIPLFEFDLHKRYRCFMFANNMLQQQLLHFVNHNFESKYLLLKHLCIDELNQILTLQEQVLHSIPENNERNIFEELTENEICYSLSHDICVGLFDHDVLVGMVSVIPNPIPDQNLLLDLENITVNQYTKVAIIDCVMVHENYRGYGIQQTLLYLSEFIARKRGVQLLCAVVSPENYYSAKNFIKCGYSMIATKPKYHSERNYYIYKLETEA